MQLPLGLESAAILGLSVSGAVQATCPDYTSYSQIPHGTPSSGPLRLPYMRPSPACRTFNSTLVERVIYDMKERLKDPDLARLFENTFPNTLDTTIKYYNESENLAFVITGDITAQWLRDTGNQFAQYHTLLALDENLAGLVKAVINNEARSISEYPYCGAFQPPPESGLPPSHNDYADGVTVFPTIDPKVVFECKFEIDSLCSFLKMSRSYYQATNDSSIMNQNWHKAVSQIFTVIEEQSQATFDSNFDFVSYYHWSGGSGSLSPPVVNNGNGEPKGYSGLVGTAFRPSDDLSTFAFLTPANAMLSIELGHLADMLQSTNQNRSSSTLARSLSKRIHDSIWENTIQNGVFAYETNGLGSHYIMDDANVPSLLSLPYLGFLNRTHPVYQATRRHLLSRKNPYFAAGKAFSGIGGPHVDVSNPWPMSQISSIFGSDDDNEILSALYMIANSTSGLGLIHESQNIFNYEEFTRPWFAWANSYFAEMMLDLAVRKPGLIFKNNESYYPGQPSVSKKKYYAF